MSGEQEKRKDISTKLRGVVYTLGGDDVRRAVGVLPRNSLWGAIRDQVEEGGAITIIDVFEVKMGDAWLRRLEQVDRIKNMFGVRTPIEGLLGSLFIQIWEAGHRARD